MIKTIIKTSSAFLYTAETLESVMENLNYGLSPHFEIISAEMKQRPGLKEPILDFSKTIIFKNHIEFIQEY